MKAILYVTLAPVTFLLAAYVICRAVASLYILLALGGCDILLTVYVIYRAVASLYNLMANAWWCCTVGWMYVSGIDSDRNV